MGFWGIFSWLTHVTTVIDDVNGTDKVQTYQIDSVFIHDGIERGAPLFLYFLFTSLLVIMAGISFLFIVFSSLGTPAYADASEYVELQSTNNDTSDDSIPISVDKQDGQCQQLRQIPVQTFTFSLNELTPLHEINIENSIDIKTQVHIGLPAPSIHVPTHTPYFVVCRNILSQSITAFLAASLLVLLTGLMPYLSQSSSTERDSASSSNLMMYILALSTFAGNELSIFIHIFNSPRSLLLCMISVAIPSILILLLYPLQDIFHSFAFLVLFVAMLSFLGSYYNSSAYHLSLLFLPEHQKIQGSIILNIINNCGYYVGMLLSLLYPLFF